MSSLGWFHAKLSNYGLKVGIDLNLGQKWTKAAIMLLFSQKEVNSGLEVNLGPFSIKIG